MIGLATFVTKCFRWVGLRVDRISNTLAYKRARFLKELAVNVVLDVGANRGQYAQQLRRHGYDGRIVSFEPLAGPFQVLKDYAARTQNQECWHVALSSIGGSACINVSENLVSSSLLEVRDECVRACPSSMRVGAEAVEICCLDSIRGRILQPSERVHLKLDTQGSEKDVLIGARETLGQVVSVEIEMSLVPLYEGQALLPEMFEFLQTRNYTCVWLERGFTDKASGHILQMDGLFLRNGN